VHDALHNLSHPGIRATSRLVTERYVWPHIQRDCRIWTRACLACQQVKVSRHVSAPLGQFKSPSARFEHIHVDLIGPLPPSSPYRYCLTAVDRYTCCPEAWPLESITAESVAKTLFAGWISRFGVPRRITTDQVRQFESKLFKALGIHSGFRRSRTTSWFHPAAKGMVERLHRQLKNAISCHRGSTWLVSQLRLLGIRNAFKPDIQATAAEMVYGEPLRLPGEFLVPSDAAPAVLEPSEFVAQLRLTMANLRPTPASHHGRRSTFIFKDLASCSHVWVRDDTVRPPFQPSYSGPFAVTARDDRTFTLLIKGQAVKVTLDRLKPAYILDDATPTPSVAVPTPTVATPTRDVAAPLPAVAAPAHTVDTPTPSNARGRHSIRCQR